MDTIRNKSTILIVDDTSSNIEILLDLLEDYDLVVATNGKEALDILSTDNSIDLILLDIMMPDIDGLEVCRLIKNDLKYPSIPVIFLTAKTDDETIVKAFELDGSDYVTKPFRPVELLTRIKTHLKLYQQQKQLALKDKYVALGDLIENISHQWRQPLSVITTAVSGMMVQKEMGVLKDEDFEQYCQTTLNSCTYLSNTIEQFTTFLESNPKEKTILKNLFDTNISLIQKVNYEDINISLNINPTIECVVSGVDLIQIIKELVTNAAQTLQDKEDKIILIDASLNNGIVDITVTDSGGGIDEKLIDKVFEPYFTTHHRSQGKGINLFKVYSLVAYSFDGSIDVKNTEFKHNGKHMKGACFTISFPQY
jgi:CheY-like chemotaxis protein